MSRNNEKYRLEAKKAIRKLTPYPKGLKVSVSVLALFVSGVGLSHAEIKTPALSITAGSAPGKNYTDNFSGAPEMVVVPAGSLQMGCVSGKGCQRYEKPVHTVRIPKAFAVGRFEVTFDEWEACVVGGGCKSIKKPSDHGWGRGKRPVINVSWDDAKSYIKWLNTQVQGEPYKLLSEAEWEYVARAGTKTQYSWGNEIDCTKANYGNGKKRNDGYGWGSSCKSVNPGKTMPVNSFQPNAFGLYNVHGNVWEWTADCWNKIYKNAPNDGTSWKSGECNSRVLRGGSWVNNPVNLRSALRITINSDSRNYVIGFRVARTLNP